METACLPAGTRILPQQGHVQKDRRDGAVKTRRKNRQTFVLQPVSSEGYPLDVEGVDLDITTNEMVSMIRESRERLG